MGFQTIRGRGTTMIGDGARLGPEATGLGVSDEDGMATVVPCEPHETRIAATAAEQRRSHQVVRERDTACARAYPALTQAKPGRGIARPPLTGAVGAWVNRGRPRTLSGKGGRLM